MSDHADYLPGMGKPWLLPLYDPLTRLLGVRAAHAQLLDGAALRPGLRVLEVGCGTGNLVVAAKRREPRAEVIGLDPDPDALKRGRRKAARGGVDLQLDRGYAEELPYADGSVDRVLSSFMFHHLTAAGRPRALAEVARVLCPGGSLHLLDFGGGSGHGHRPVARRLQDSGGDRIPELMAAAGLTGARATGHGRALFGRYTFWSACRPA